MTTDYRPSQPLERALFFTTDDLAANRAGRLTDRQNALLRESGRPFRRLLVILGVFTLLVGGTLLFAGGSPDAPMLFLLTLMVPGILGVIFAVRLAGIYASVGDGRVLAAEGLADVYNKHALRGGTAFYVRIGREEFFISRALQDAFEPGRAYRVFYTPKGRIIVAGEFAPTPSPDTRASRLVSTELATALGFSREDLEANRDGHMSPAQAAKVSRRRNGDIAAVIICAVVIAAVVGLSTLAEATATGLIFVGLVLLFPVVYLALSVRQAWRRSQDLGSPVALASGRLERQVEETRSSRQTTSYYYLLVGGMRLQVSLDAYGAFADGGHYAVYHTPHNRELLSAEPLDALPPVERTMHEVMLA